MQSMATKAHLPVHQQQRIDRSRSSADAQRSNKVGDGTGVDIRASLPPIYRDQGKEGGGGQGQQGNHTQLAKAIRGTHTALIPAHNKNNVPLFNQRSAARFWDMSPSRPAAERDDASATEAYRERFWWKYYNGAARAIQFKTPGYSAQNPHVVNQPNYDIPAPWTHQIANGMLDARVNATDDGRPAKNRLPFYNAGGRIRV